MRKTTLNSFQIDALTELKEAGFDAAPRGNWVEVYGGYRPEPVYSYQGVSDYISRNAPPRATNDRRAGRTSCEG